MFNKILNDIKAISVDVFQKTARDADKYNEFPKKNFDLIKQYNLQTLLVPKEYGGFGLSFHQYQECLVEMAKGCASTASAFNMHNIVVGTLASIDLTDFNASEKQRLLPYLESFYNLVVHKKAIIAAATTEPGIGARFSQVKTNYQKQTDGFLLNGHKSFVTMSSYADYFLVLGNKHIESGTSDPMNLTYFLVDRHLKGVSVKSNWDTLGMCGTDSGDVFFDDVRLPYTSLLMGKVGFALSKVMREPHWITGGYLGVYLGVMEAAFDFTCEYINSKSNHSKQTGLAYQPLIQARISDMFVLLNNARLNVFDAAIKVDTAPGTTNTNRAIYAAKYLLGETSVQLTSMAIKTCGGSSIRKEHDLERYFRDSRCGGLMPAVSDVCQYAIGRSLLKIEDKEGMW